MNATKEPTGVRASQPWPTRAICASIFVALLAIYHSNGRDHAGVDTIAAPYTAWSIARHGSLDLSGYDDLRSGIGRFVFESPDGRIVSMRSPGSAIAALPFIAPVAAFREQPLSMLAMNRLGKLAAAFSVAGAALLFYLVCRRLAPDAVVPATILFALGTGLWSVASQTLWMHGPATFCLCLSLYVLLPAPRDSVPGFGRAFGAGLMLGMALLTRPTTALFGAATALSLAAQRRWLSVLGLALGAVPSIAIYAFINISLFGDPIRGGYKNDNWEMPTPLSLGVAGLLIAPSRGLFVYSPALLLIPLGAFAFWRRGMTPESWPRLLLAFWGGAAVLTVGLFAKWHDWRGGWCFGPRFLIEIMPVCCLLFAFAYAAWRGTALRSAAHFLIALSIFVQFVGVHGRSAEDSWCPRHELADQGRCLFSLHDTQIEAYSRAMLARHWQRFQEWAVLSK